MKRLSLIVAALLGAMLAVFVPMGTASAGTPMEIPLIAGQSTTIGSVAVSDDGTDMTVTYTVTAEGWYLTQTHLYVGTKAPTKVAPGSFPYAHIGLHATTDTYTVPITVGTKYYVAVHSTVLNQNNIIGYDETQIIGYDYSKIIGYDCPSLAEIAAALPTGVTIQTQWDNDNNSYFDMDFSGSSLPALNGTQQDTWCIDESHTIYVPAGYTANLYLSYGDLPTSLTSGTDPFIHHPENLDLVNWVINNQTGYNATEVQNVIWKLVDNPDLAITANEQVLYDAALTHDGFVPDFAAGDVVAVIVAPVGGYSADAQVVIAQVTAFGLGMPCTPLYQPLYQPLYKSETAWAMASGGTPFAKGASSWGTYFTYQA